MKPRRSLLLSGILLLVVLPALPQVECYSPMLVPTGLKKNANATIIKEDIRLIYHTDGSASWESDRTIVVWNSKGDEHANFYAGYDDFRSLKSFRGFIYNLKGQETRVISSSELKDISADSRSFIDDFRMKVFEPQANEYPYTIRYVYTINYHSPLFIRDWWPQPDFYLSVLHAGLTVKAPKAIKFIYKELNLKQPVVITQDEKTITYSWSVDSLSAIKDLPYQPFLEEITPGLLTGIEQFKIEGVEGDLLSWEGYGSWIAALNDGRQVLPPETVNKLKSIVEGITSIEEAVCRIYEHLQSRTRYVSIQLGIGGLQPEEAEKVDALGYGDCKGLTNYTMAMLKAVGIPSYYCLVNSGGRAPEIIAEFPSNQFDHVILCVPSGSDTIWLECTSQVNPCAYLGAFTYDRLGLLIDGQQSRLVRTQIHPLRENVKRRRAMIYINETGYASAEVSSGYAGLFYGEKQPLLYLSREEQSKWFYQELDIPKFWISDFRLSDFRDGSPRIEEWLGLELDRYATLSGKRMFLPLNLMTRIDAIPAQDTSRKYDLRIHHSFIETDTIIHHLPASFIIEALPDPVSIECAQGRFEMNVHANGPDLIYTRYLELEKGIYPPSTYAAFSDFYKKIVYADKAKAILILKE